MTTFKDLFDSGHCVQQYSANPNAGESWLFRGELYETPKGAVRKSANESLNVYIAQRTEVLAARVNNG